MIEFVTKETLDKLERDKENYIPADNNEYNINS